MVGDESELLAVLREVDGDEAIGEGVSTEPGEYERDGGEPL